MTEIPRIDPIQTSNAVVHAPSQTESSPRFQELLERLQKITAQQPAAEEVESPEELQEALRTADDGFVAAMDLRRQLEEAFKRHM
ncbi:MAG: hypothetical protein ACI8UD_000594 [Planctomycetota bacterium]|jgi:hypothetical protein